MTKQAANKQEKSTSGEAQLPTTANEALAQTEPCANSGNPIFSCMGKVEVVQDDLVRDPSYKSHHPLYQTTSSCYGELPCYTATVPSTYHGKSQQFSRHLGECGMYRNFSLNTSMTRSKVYDQPKM